MKFADSRPFQSQTLDEDKDKRSKVFTIRLNTKEQADIIQASVLLRQKKLSTSIKQLCKIGLQNVLHDEKTRTFLGIVSNNSRKNERLGIMSEDFNNKQM
jgi:hypothetical protein